MSGEQNPRPSLEGLIEDLRQRVFEIERRIEGDEVENVYLNDLVDVRVDELVDGTIDIGDGSALMYRASDKMWIPGAGGGGGYWTYAGGQLLAQAAGPTPDLINVTIAPSLNIVFDGFDDGGDPEDQITILQSRGQTIINGDNGLTIEANDGGIFIDDDGAGSIDIESTGAIYLYDSSGIGIYITEDGGGIWIDDPNGGIHFQAGEVCFRNTTATPSLDGNESFAIYLDPTPGSASIKIRAKNSSGTVVNSAPIPLT